MGQPYFVRDYQNFVAQLCATLPLDQAMARAVGSDTVENYDHSSKAALSMLEGFGFAAGHSLIDVGCGSGGLARQIFSRFGNKVTYLGTDIVPEMLNFAQARTPLYRFVPVSDCSIPAADTSADFVTLFSVFTHLRRRDVARYMNEAIRVLKPGGKLVFTYLEVWRHAWLLRNTIIATLLGRCPVENHFTSESAIARGAKRHGFLIEAVPAGRVGQIGASIAVLRRPASRLSDHSR